MSKESLSYFLVVEIEFIENPKFNVSIKDIDLIGEGETPHLEFIKDILLITDTKEKAELAAYAATESHNGEKIYIVREIINFFF